MPAISSLLLGASAASGLVGAFANMSAQERAALMQEKAVQEWMKLNVPDIASQQMDLEEFIQTGKLTPALEGVVTAADSEFQKIQGDPALKESRLRALGALEAQGYGGEQVQDEAAREQAIIDSGAANRGRQEAVLGSLERRGQLGSGLELAARQDAAQAEGDRLSSQALDLESQRRQRALQSISGAGDLAGSIQDQDYKMASDKARAADTINMFNTQNMQNVGNRNVDRTNDASRYNLGTEQDIANKNTSTRNYEQEKNKALIQQKFQNDAAVAAGKSGQYGQQAANTIQAGQNAGNMWGGIASGAAQASAGFGKKNAFSDDEIDKIRKGLPANG